ncbi:MAG TPA: hypothetical protein VFS02_04705 [Telluria sp.]|nr:hypothetical protein [Telluria sp.]
MLALVSLLFMQLAVVAYACPMRAHETVAPMADCHGMDHASPTLCQAHAEPVKQSLDKVSTPTPQPFVAAAILFEVAGLDQLMPRSAQVAPSDIPAAGAAPPIAILHCCFRI